MRKELGARRTAPRSMWTVATNTVLIGWPGVRSASTHNNTERFSAELVAGLHNHPYLQLAASRPSVQLTAIDFDEAFDEITGSARS